MRRYIRYEDGKVKVCPQNDYEGKITGKIVFNIPAYFDENPEERKRLGWILHRQLTRKEIKARVEWDERSQVVVTTPKWVDEWTVEDEPHVMDKSEEMMLREELSTTSSGYANFAYYDIDGEVETEYVI